MTKTTYQKLTESKRSWTPVQVTRGEFVPGSDAAMKRALALRCLELPVKEFLEQGMKTELPDIPGLYEALMSNCADEEKHDVGLNYVVSAHGVDEDAEEEAKTIKKFWLEDPSHPILKASVLERAVFFVMLPYFRFNGDIGLRTLSADISRDERVHTAVHGMVSYDMGERPTKALNKLRKATISWVMEPLGNSSNKYLDRNFWLRQSDNLYYKGKAEGLVETQRARFPSFFETSNLNLPKYG